MGVKNDDVIKIEYEISYEDGNVFDSSDLHGGPFKLHVGTGQILTAVENKIIGMDVGEEKSFLLTPTEGFGEFNPLLVEKIEKSQFPADMSLELGKQLEVMGPNGMSSPGWIRLMEDDYIIVDMNHPCAGQNIKFKVKVIEMGLEADPIQNPFSFGFSCDCGCDHH